MTPDAANVLATFKRATPADIRFGFHWYNRAHDFALSLCDEITIAAGVIAALSPNNHWETNKKAAAKAFANGTALGTHFISSERKVDAILAGAAPLDILGGRKVRAFYETIVNPDGFFVPTIDRHAFDIAVGITGAYLANNGTQILKRKGMHDAFVQAYIDAGIALSLGAPRVQAITWTTHRREKGIK